MDSWSLGFLWGCGRVSGDYFLVQSKRKDLVEKVKNKVSSKSRIFPIDRETGESWRVKIPMDNDYIKWMTKNGYDGRIGNEERDMPIFENLQDEAEFLRGYFSTHFTQDTFKNKGRIVPRLRFYASEKILGQLNKHLNNTIGTGIKKVQKHGRSEICHILYYTSRKEVPAITEYLELNKTEEIIDDKIIKIKCANDKCNNVFLPKFNNHRFCSRRCQDVTYKRNMYAR